MNRRISLSILLLFILSSVLVAFHYHNDTLIHDDCSLCTYNLHNSFVDSQNNYEISSSDYSLNITADDLSNHLFIKKPFSSRAPPV
jgi:hypothetical protein